MKNWFLINIDTFDTNDLPKWMNDTLKPNSLTKFARLLDHYGSMGELFNAGPWDWIKQPSIGLHTVNVTSLIINHYSDTKVIPAFSSLEMISQLGRYVGYLETSAKIDMMEAILSSVEDGDDAQRTV